MSAGFIREALARSFERLRFFQPTFLEYENLILVFREMSLEEKSPLSGNQQNELRMNCELRRFSDFQIGSRDEDFPENHRQGQTASAVLNINLCVNTQHKA